HLSQLFFILFFFLALPPPRIYTLSLHDALPILKPHRQAPTTRPTRTRKFLFLFGAAWVCAGALVRWDAPWLYVLLGVTVFAALRSEEHTSELQSLRHLVCRLLLEKKKKHNYEHV